MYIIYIYIYITFPHQTLDSSIDFLKGVGRIAQVQSSKSVDPETSTEPGG